MLNKGLNPILTIIFAPSRYIIIGKANTAKFIRIADVIFLHFDEIQSIVSEAMITPIVLKNAIKIIYCNTVMLIGKFTKSVMLRIVADSPL